MSFQKYTDSLLAQTLLPLIPDSISPNMVSSLRIASLPFIALALYDQHYAIGFVVFAIAALTDALDGAMARVRNRVTETGKILDAVADRGLIALVAVVLVPRFFGWWLVVVLGVLECGNGIAAYRSSKKIGMNPGANWAGKVKMVLQCIAFLFLFAGMAGAGAGFFEIAYFFLIASAPFAAIQMFAYPQTYEEAVGK